MSKLRYRNNLSLKQDGKSVPYGGSGEIRADGDANYGFKDLKGHSALLTSVPELVRDPVLLEFVRTINSAQSALFSIGCNSSDVTDEQGSRRSGYVEFAFNSVGLVADASNYFPVFFHFDRYLFSIESELQIAFDWELMGAHFLDRRVDGFTCSIIVNTFYTTSTDTARIHWAEALALLGEYLGDVGPKSADYIYPVDA